MTHDNSENDKDNDTAPSAARRDGPGGEDLTLTDEDEEILNRIWMDPAFIEQTIKQSDRERGTAGKTLDYKTGLPLSQEQMDFFNHGPYSKGESKRTRADWLRVQQYEAEQGIESTIPAEYQHFLTDSQNPKKDR